MCFTGSIIITATKCICKNRVETLDNGFSGHQNTLSFPGTIGGGGDSETVDCDLSITV